MAKHSAPKAPAAPRTSGSRRGAKHPGGEHLDSGKRRRGKRSSAKRGAGSKDASARSSKSSVFASARANVKTSLGGLRQGMSRFAQSLGTVPGMKYLRHAARSVTSVGWVVLFSALIAAIVSRAFGWVEAFFVACACLLAFLIAVVWVIVPSPHKVSVRLPRQRIVAGQTAVGEITAENMSDRRARSGLIELPIASSALQFLVPPLPGKGVWSEVFSVVTHRRGLVTVGPARALRADPLGLIRRIGTWSEPATLYVHPKTIRVPFDATGIHADVEGVTTAKLSSSDVSFHALRDYVPGDDRRNVHWPMTAHIGRLVVRQFEETRRSHHLVVLDTRLGQWNDRDSFENAVSIAASLVVADMAASRTVSLTTATDWVTTSAATRMLDAMCVIHDSGEADLMARLREAIAKRPGLSVVTIIAAPTVDDDQASHLLNAIPVDVRSAVVRVRPGHPKLRRLSHGTLADCPTLEDLPRLVAAGGLA